MNIIAESISSAWEQSIAALIADGSDLTYTQRGVRAKELIGVRLEILSPAMDAPLSPLYVFGDLFVEEYWRNIVQAASGEQSIGSRITRSSSVVAAPNSQVARAVELLKREPESRRVLISLWDAEVDMFSEHPPCVSSIQFFVRTGKLDVLAYLRSNDAWMAAVPDMVSIVRLGSEIAAQLGIGLGRYVHYAASYHLYEPDIVPATVGLRNG